MARAVTVNSIISGVGTTLDKNDGAVLTLNAANSYSGTTSVNAGTTTISSTGSLTNSTTIGVSNGAGQRR